MEHFRLLIALVFSVLCFTPRMLGQTQLAKWDFQDTVIPTGVTNNIEASSMTISSGIIGFQNGSDDGGTKIGNAASWNQGDFSTSGKYLQFSTKPNEGFEIDYDSIVLRFGRTAAGPQKVTVRYSLDGFATAGTTILDGGSVTSENANSLDSFTIPSNVLPGESVSTTLTVRIWGHNASGTGNLRFNNFVVNGSVTEIPPPPPAPGTISGTVSYDGSGLAGVLVKLSESVFHITDADGAYSFADVTPGDYDVMIVEPLGLTADATQKSTTVESGGSNTVDFTLSAASLANNARSIGYWKHQFDVYVTGRGKAQETQADLNTYITRVHDKYTPHFDVFVGKTSYADWQGVLTVNGKASMLDRAKQQLAAFVLNLVSFKINQLTPVSEDNRTADDALTYVSALVSDGDASNDEQAKNIAEMVNTQQLIGAGEVPAGSLLFKGERNFISWSFGPAEYALYQNYPNPFNPTTQIRFDVPEVSHVRLAVFDLLGREITTLFDGELPAGQFERFWNGRDANGTWLGSGVYFLRIEAKSKMSDKQLSAIRRMILLK